MPCHVGDSHNSSSLNLWISWFSPCYVGNMVSYLYHRLYRETRPNSSRPPVNAITALVHIIITPKSSSYMIYLYSTSYYSHIYPHIHPHLILKVILTLSSYLSSKLSSYLSSFSSPCLAVSPNQQPPARPKLAGFQRKLTNFNYRRVSIQFPISLAPVLTF